mgnify:FL=1
MRTRIYFYPMIKHFAVYLLFALAVTGSVHAQVTYHADIGRHLVISRKRHGADFSRAVAAYGNFIEYVTSIGYMPPWTPDADYSHFVGERVLTAEEVETISAWVDADMPEGNPDDNPGLPSFPEGSQIGEPDLVFSMPEPFTHAGNMSDQYQVFVMPTGSDEDIHVRALEVRPGNGAIAHHAILGVDIEGTAQFLDSQDPAPGYESFGDFGFEAYENFFGGWVPGTQTVVYPEGIGRVIPANSDLLIQMHYGPTSVEGVDQTEVNVFLTDSPIEREVTTGIMGPWTLGEPFFIPANQVKTFHGEYNIPVDLSFISIVPHCHLVGVSWEVFATGPGDLDTIPLISIPAWDFNWQGFFTFPYMTKVPAGYTLHGIATYDNTANNPFNPSDPPAMVQYGDHTEDEMFFVFFDYVLYADGDEDISLETPLLSSVEPMERRAPGVRVHPNPASSKVQVLVHPEFVGTPWALADLGGRVMSEGVFHSGNDRILLEDLSEGVYFLRTAQGTERVVIQR